MRHLGVIVGAMLKVKSIRIFCNKCAQFYLKYCFNKIVCIKTTLNQKIKCFFTFQILDGWHPLEKAQYPEYFARRDVRKREFLERQEKKMLEYEEQKKLEGNN